MYTVDSKDTVVELKGVPQSSVGAPNPMIIAGEHTLLLAYCLQNTPHGWDGTSIRIVAPYTSGEPIGLVRFARPYAHMFGPPNDEAFTGHPLAERGVGPYGVWEITNSSWIRSLAAMNSVHPCHSWDLFKGYRHIIFAFHDTTFECVAESFSYTVHNGSVAEVILAESKAL